MGFNPNSLPARYKQLAGIVKGAPVKRGKSKLESRFLYIWTLLKGPALQREFKAVPGRQFRWDFYHSSSGLLIEIQGGTWSNRKSGHNSGSGIQRDCAKLRMATLRGFRPIAFTEKEINTTEIEKVIAFAIQNT